MDTTIRKPEPVPALYERLVGPAWREVPEAIRGAHPEGGVLRARGTFRVEHGRSRLARLLARLLRLPLPRDAVPVRLRVTPSARGERWERTLGEWRLVSVQHEAPGGLLAERFGLLELRFRLRAEAGALRYFQQEAAVAVGRLRLVLPAWLAPRVSAAEVPAGVAGRSCTAVDVSLPLLGRLLRYEGELEVEEASA